MLWYDRESVRAEGVEGFEVARGRAAGAGDVWMTVLPNWSIRLSSLWPPVRPRSRASSPPWTSSALASPRWMPMRSLPPCPLMTVGLSVRALSTKILSSVMVPRKVHAAGECSAACREIGQLEQAERVRDARGREVQVVARGSSGPRDDQGLSCQPPRASSTMVPPGAPRIVNASLPSPPTIVVAVAAAVLDTFTFAPPLSVSRPRIWQLA